MADKILRKENDQFIYKDLITFDTKVNIGYSTNGTELDPLDFPVSLNVLGTDGIAIPAGTELQRPVASLPMLRFNSDSNEFEKYTPSSGTWTVLGDGGGGTSSPYAIEKIGDGYAGILKDVVPRGLNALDIQTVRVFPTFVPTGLHSIALGANNTANGDYSTAIGSLCVATGYESIALGAASEANGSRAVSLGYDSVAGGEYSVAIGNETLAGGEHSYAGGSVTKATGSYSHATGFETSATNTYSTATGSRTVASGLHSTATGFSSRASGDFSTANGDASKAIGDYSIALGYGPSATGDYSIALGEDIYASGLHSVAMGTNSVATGRSSYASGYSTRADGEFATAVGNTSTATGNYTTARGLNTIAVGAHAVATGYQTNVDGTHSYGFGPNVTINGNYTSALGSMVSANGDFSCGVGTALHLYGNHVYAFGDNMFNNNEYSVVIGTSDNNKISIRGNGNVILPRTTNIPTVIGLGNGQLPPNTMTMVDDGGVFKLISNNGSTITETILAGGGTASPYAIEKIGDGYVGGNKNAANPRGLNALDIQTVRSAPVHVASGMASVAIGVDNIVDGDSSMVFGHTCVTDSSAVGSIVQGIGCESHAPNAHAIGTNVVNLKDNSIDIGLSNFRKLSLDITGNVHFPSVATSVVGEDLAEGGFNFRMDGSDLIITAKVGGALKEVAITLF